MAEIIRPKFGERPPIRATSTWEQHEARKCQHKALVVCAERRTVQCDDCEEYLDAVSVLLEQARGYRNTDYKLSEMNLYEEKMKKMREKEKERREKKSKKDPAAGE